MSEQPGKDVYRDTAVRYLGYANEVGEAFRSIVPASVVHFSYGVASAYVLADTIDKASKTYKTAGEDSRACKTLGSAMDTLIWQSFASVIIPGFTINRVCALSLYTMTKLKVPAVPAKLATTIIGLACIPFIIKPIDEAVDHVMDRTLRKITVC